MIDAHGMHGRYRPGYGAQPIHAAAVTAGDRAGIGAAATGGADPDCGDAAWK